jgi:hypothetical protein
MMHDHWLSIAHHDSQPLAQHNNTVIYNHWLIIAHHDSQSLAHHEQVVVHHGVLC